MSQLHAESIAQSSAPDSVEPQQAISRRCGVGTPNFADITTMGVGGRIREFVQPRTTESFIAAVRDADQRGLPLCVIGGGSNLLVGDDAFNGVVVRDARHEIFVKGGSGAVYEPCEAGGDDAGAGGETRKSAEYCGQRAVTLPAPANAEARVCLEAAAGTNWDDFVAHCTKHGLAQIQGLSGIPGTVGASVVQNIGAYGQEVANCVESVTAWDRQNSKIVALSNRQLQFGYRSSLLKKSMYRAPGVPSDCFFPTPRYVVLSVVFCLPQNDMCRVDSTQLASALGVEPSTAVANDSVRSTVLAVRARKGMLEDPYRYDSKWMDGTRNRANIDKAQGSLDRVAVTDRANRHSCGSFFMNPVLSVADARGLPEDAPRYRVSRSVGDADDSEEPNGGGTAIKTSAAWLIDHAGFHKGFALESPLPSQVSLSTAHTLALTNRGSAKSADIANLAQTIQLGVFETFGVRLVPEPVVVGMHIG